MIIFNYSISLMIFSIDVKHSIEVRGYLFHF